MQLYNLKLFYHLRKLQDAAWYEKQAIALMQQLLYKKKDILEVVTRMKANIEKGEITTTSGLTITEEVFRSVLDA